MEVLRHLPRCGRVVPEVGDERVRELSLDSYRLIYEIAGSDVFMLAIVHKRRELKRDDLAPHSGS